MDKSITYSAILQKMIFSAKMAEYKPKLPLSICTKVPLVGTLKLFQEMPDAIRKELGQTYQPFRLFFSLITLFTIFYELEIKITTGNQLMVS